jgi:IclR family transcriptional regulator, KDG regulon repressor
MVASGATSLRRGLAIVLALGEEEANGNETLGVVQIAGLVGREKSQVSRTLQTLAEFGIVERDAVTRGYRLGWRVYALAARAGEPRLLAAARPAIERLVERVGERAHLSVLEGVQVLTLLSEGPPLAVQAAGWVGRRVPAYCTSAGRALLFDRGRNELETLFADVELRPLGPASPTSVSELAERIAEARALGYAAADEELEAGLVAVAAPVRDFAGRIVAALDVSGPRFRFGEHFRSAGPDVLSAADDLSAALGAR